MTWVDVPGWEGRYQVSTLGQVRALSEYRRWKPGRLVTGTVMKRGGYLRLSLRAADGGECSRFAHDIVLEAFIGPAPAGHQARHLNGVPTDNALGNLRWGTAKENAEDRDRHGRTARGDRHPRTSITETQRSETRTWVAGGRTRRSVAAELGLSYSLVVEVVLRRRSYA
jgi:hypothetical protein